MNILLCTDNNYVQHCAATMVSVLHHNINVNIYIFSTDISSKNRLILTGITEKYGCKIEFVILEDSLLDNFPMSEKASSHISIATYFRLFVEAKLPIEINKILYLDSDIIVRKNLSLLWNINLDSFALGAVFQYNEWAIDNNTYQRLGYDSELGYFNAGVLLINLEYWRKMDVTNRLFKYIKENYNNIISHDQDTLNAVLFNEVIALECKWNFLPFFFDSTLAKVTFPRDLNYHNEVKIVTKDPSIVHFVYKPKPWEFGCNHPFKRDYFYYLYLTPWKGWRPKVSIKKYINYSLIPFMLNLRRKMIKFFKIIK